MSVIAPSERLRGVPVVLLAFSVAGVAGFITPGAPVGVGVREAVLVSILAIFIDEADRLMAAVISLRFPATFFFLTSFIIREAHW